MPELSNLLDLKHVEDPKPDPKSPRRWACFDMPELLLDLKHFEDPKPDKTGFGPDRKACWSPELSKLLF